MIRKRFVVAFVLAASLFSSPAHAENTTMEALLNGALLKVSPEGETPFTVTFLRDGTYTTSEGAFGIWAIDGEVLCTRRSPNSNVKGRAGKGSCGVFPGGKSIGSEWVLPAKSGSGNVTWSVVAPSK